MTDDERFEEERWCFRRWLQKWNHRQCQLLIDDIRLWMDMLGGKENQVVSEELNRKIEEFKFIQIMKAGWK